ncbi:MAG: hypothetical protein E7585_04970 [Ruminococcaceae bacterium]|nr:hypothetical protein [Oscillospiraceae bacterium]
MKKIAFVLLFLFFFALITVGYATLSQEFHVQGTSYAAPPPKGIFIVGVEVIDSQNVTDVDSGYTPPTNLRSSVSATAGGSITYKITVENNSDLTYWFREILYLDDLQNMDNSLLGANNGIQIVVKDKIADTTVTFNNEDWVPPHTTRDFYAIYSFGSAAAGTTVTTLVNFSFGGRIASYGDEILSILNDPEKYAVLSDAFDEAYISDHSTIIGNIGADVGLFDTLLGPDLKLDGNPVKIMIERSNMDGKATGDSYASGGPSGCEYTIYVTTEDLSGNTTVYAVSYTREANGEWRQIGELYEGTTPLGTYVDSTGEAYVSFDPDKWEAVPKTYIVFTYKGNSVTYKVNEKYGNSYQQQFKLEDLMSMQDQELYNQLNNHQILKDAYQILFKDHVGSNATEILLLRDAYEDALRFYEMRNQGQEFSLSNTATRAELLSTVEALAKAMDYYLQVHDTDHQ